jgi:ABC-type transport system substrate-binding protein/class 3 adenylate cyclase
VADHTSSGEHAPLVSGADVRTFLFADFRGYTRFTQEHGDEAASALANRFAELAGRTVSEFEGELLELRGDEALCVFRSARQALRAAVELQRRFRTGTDGRPALPLGVGMGLDAGEAVPTNGGYRGASLNLAARLCAIAKPGEILASETVIRLASRVEGLRFLEGRSARLKGMARPVRFVVVAPDEPLPPVPEPSPRARITPPRVWIGAVMAAIVVIAAATVGLTRSDKQAVTLRPNTLVELDPSRLTVERQVAVAQAPTAAVFGGGALWVANASSNQVVRVDPDGGTPVPIPVGTAPSGLAYAFDALWVANAGDGTVMRITPAAGNTNVPIPVGNDPSALAATENGVWVASGLDHTVKRINPLGQVANAIPLSSPPSDLTSFGDSIWVAEPNAGTVVRIDARTIQITGSIPVPGGPEALAVGAGRLWVASADGTLTGVDPTSTVPQVMWTVRIGDSPGDLAVADGSAWIGSTATDSLTEVSPMGQVEQTVRVGTPTTNVTAAGDRLWVAALPSLAAHQGGTLVGAVSSLASQNTDPVQVTDSLNASMVQLTNDGLVALRKVAGSGGYELVPDLAAALPAPTDGGLTYTFQVRRRIHYSTGAVVKASDVRSSMERALTSNYAGAKTLLDGIVGAETCSPPGRNCRLKGIVTDDNSGTATFHLTAPDPDFLAKLSVVGLAIVPAGTPRDLNGHLRVPATGPYEITRNDVNRKTGIGKIVLTRNRKFHVWSSAAQPVGYPDQIVFRARYSGQNASRRDWRDVESGNADWTADPIPTNEIPTLTSRYGGQLHLIASDTTFYAVIDETSRPFNDVRVRQALNYAIDRRRVLDEVGGKYAGTVTCQFLPPSFPGYRPYCPYTQSAAPAAAWTAPDMTKARALVRESGTTRERVLVGGFSDPVQTELAKALREIGYRVTTRVFPPTPDGYNEYATWLGMPSRPPHVAISLGWIADYPGAYDFLKLFACSNLPGVNAFATFYCQPSFDRHLRHALQVQLTDPAAANRLWAEADRYITNQAVTIPLWNPVSAVLVSKDVGNVQYTPAGTSLPFIDQMWVK